MTLLNQRLRWCGSIRIGSLLLLWAACLISCMSGNAEGSGLSAHQRQGLFEILHGTVERASQLPVGRDTTPPRVMRVEFVTHPDDASRRRVIQPGNAFVGNGSIEVRVTVSEPLASPPRVQLRQANGFLMPAALTGSAANPLFVYRLVPNPAPGANGPATLEITGEFDGQAPDFGYDRANNPLVAFVQSRALLVDTVPPGLKRVDTRIPGNSRSIPAEGRSLPANGFPREISVFVQDYNSRDDGSFSGPNVATDLASGVDFGQVGQQVSLRVRDPRGRVLPGNVVARPPSLVLLLPDPYNPGTGVFPDTDGDGRADPIEGTYRIEVDLVDQVGNRTSSNLLLGLDATPIGAGGVSVAIRPVFDTPFPNPPNPIPGQGAAVKRLRRVEVSGVDEDFDLIRSTARLLSRPGGEFSVPREVRTRLSRADGLLVLDVVLDQDGDGRDDFENPPPGQFLPPGATDPRLGRNDGVYIVEITAVDRAGNSSVLTRELVLDTTPPSAEASFPTTTGRFRGPLRIVDAFLDDPAASSGSAGSGISLSDSHIQLLFSGNEFRQGGPVRGVVFTHAPNPDDPSRPDFNPAGRRFKILFSIVDARGQSESLPTDGSADGVYTMSVVVRDRAGNESTFTSSFEYTQAATEPMSSPLILRSQP